MARTKARAGKQRTRPGSEPRTPVSADLAKRFTAEYLVDLNATQAYKRATGCTNDATAATNGWRLLRNADIQQAVQASTRRQLKTAELTAVRVLEELRRVAFFDAADVFTADGRHLKRIDEMAPEARAVIAGLEVATANFDRTDGKRNYREWLHKIKLASKLHALELLAKHFKLLDRAAENENGDFDKFIARINAARARVATEKKGTR